MWEKKQRNEEETNILKNSWTENEKQNEKIKREKWVKESEKVSKWKWKDDCELVLMILWGGRSGGAEKKKIRILSE